MSLLLLFGGAGGSTYSVIAGQGSYTLTGQNATLTRQSTLVVAAGNYTLTGQSLSLLKSSKLTAVFGSYHLTGSDNLASSSVYVKRNGSWVIVNAVYKKINGVWKPVIKLSVYSGGRWQTELS